MISLYHTQATPNPYSFKFTFLHTIKTAESRAKHAPCTTLFARVIARVIAFLALNNIEFAKMYVFSGQGYCFNS